MRICTNHKTTGKRVVLENDLVDDTRTGSPETKAILAYGIKDQGSREVQERATYLSRSGGQKVVHFLVDLLGTLKILDPTNLCFDQVVTVNSGRDSSRVHACRHELQQGHLKSMISALN